jgi:hypothetical protein
MADEFKDDEIIEEASANLGDVDMCEGEEEGHHALPPAQNGHEESTEPRTTFISYLTSPIVTLLVGNGGAGTALRAHQSLLVQSPYFSAACAGFTEDDGVSCCPTGPVQLRR